MHPVEIEECLKSMIIYADSREQPTEQYVKRLNSMGIPWERKHLDYGDYTYGFKQDGKIIGELTLPPYKAEDEKSREKQVGAWLNSMEW